MQGASVYTLNRYQTFSWWVSYHRPQKNVHNCRTLKQIEHIAQTIVSRNYQGVVQSDYIYLQDDCSHFVLLLNTTVCAICSICFKVLQLYTHFVLLLNTIVSAIYSICFKVLQLWTFFCGLWYDTHHENVWYLFNV